MIRLIPLCLILLIVIGCQTCGGGSMSIQDKYEQMLYPTVRIDTDSGAGSGVAIDTTGGYTVILTAKHVVEGKKKVRVRFYPSENEYPGEVTKISEEHDLAIVMVAHEHKHIAKRTTPTELLVFQETFKIGAALGSTELRVTEGVVSTVDEFTFVTSSPVVWGDSGGGIFIHEDGEYILVGITVQLAVGMGIFPVYHMGIAVDMFAVEEFLEQ